MDTDNLQLLIFDEQIQQRSCKTKSRIQTLICQSPISEYRDVITYFHGTSPGNNQSPSFPWKVNLKFVSSLSQSWSDKTKIYSVFRRLLKCYMICFICFIGLGEYLLTLTKHGDQGVRERLVRVEKLDVHLSCYCDTIHLHLNIH